jgi:hypothetical protein
MSQTYLIYFSHFSLLFIFPIRIKSERVNQMVCPISRAVVAPHVRLLVHFRPASYPTDPTALSLNWPSQRVKEILARKRKIGFKRIYSRVPKQPQTGSNLAFGDAFFSCRVLGTSTSSRILQTEFEFLKFN